MRPLSAWVCGAALTLAGIGMHAEEASARVEAGTLTCEVGKGFALILSKPRDLHCVFHKSNGQTEAYAGKLREIGLDVGVSGRGVIAWGVIAATTNLSPGELAGTYAGVEAGAAAVIGGRGRLLVGGRRGTVSLQPLSVQGEVGLNIAVGIASMSLHPLFRVHASSNARVPAVGHSHDAVPHAQQIPHYGCGSYTHLQRGQTLSGLAHACGVTLEALLDANPQITNVRDIDAGALVHLPTHVGHHDSSPCGDRGILRDNELLDHLAWRCGVTMHALLLENPSVREMAMVQPGLVLAIPAKGAPKSGPPVHYAMTGADILPAQGFVVSAAPAATIPIPHMSPLDDRPSGGQMSMRARARLEIICVNEATNRYGFTPGDVFATGSAYSSGQTITVSLDANSQDGVCLIDETGKVLFVTDLSAARGRPAATAVAGAAIAGTLAATTAGRSSSPSAARSATAQSGSGDRTEVVRFAPGASSATVQGSVSGYDLSNYVLGAGGGQVMSVLFSPDNNSCYFNILPPSGDTAIFNGSINGNEFADTLPASGDYTVQAYLMRNAARRNETCRYSITIEISGGGTAAVAPSAPGAGERVSTDTAGQACVGHAANQFGVQASAFRVISVQGSTEGTGVEIVATDGRQGRCFVGPYGEVINFEPSGGATARAPTGAAGGTDVAERACLAAAVNQTQERNVVVLSSEFSEANSVVMVGVGDNRAPWRCLVYNDGVVAEIFFTGDDSAGVPSPQATAPSPTQSGSVTESACLSAVAKETNEGDVAVLGSEFSEANSVVMIGVGANRAPWRCLVSNDGVVSEVFFTGDDSAGVDQSAAAAPVGGQPAAPSEVSDAAQQSCLSAVTNETNEGDVAVLSAEFSEANSLVMIGVGADRAPWRCLVANDGAVQEVFFAGDEGKL